MKVLIADNLSPTVDQIFSVKSIALTFWEAWLGAFSYTFQIYFDFAGHSSMAIGLALMFGFHFPENFNRPYIASSVTEFWKRWHMSLSRWLRDYLFIPLGGSRKSNSRTYVNLVTVFFICGLWHGAAWTFVLWGLYQGILLILEKILKNKFNYQPSGLIGIVVTFLLTTIGWVIFRSDSFTQCQNFLGTMFSIPNLLDIFNPEASLEKYLEPLLVTSLTTAILFSFFPFQRIISKIQPDGKFILIGNCISTIVVLSLTSIYAIGNTFKPFIYFRF